jgi:hypothetical protein
MENQAQAAERGGLTFAARLIVGLLQGAALYLLYSAFEDKVWPVTDPAMFGPLAICALFVPLLVIQSLGNMRLFTLIVWTALAVAAAAGAAWYDLWQAWPGMTEWRDAALLPRVLPSFGTFFFTAAFLFIAQALIAAGDADRRVVAHYRTHFDIAWKQALQLVLAFLFVGIFWALLWLGAVLFKMINLDFLEKLIEHRWFWIPATTAATAAAVHITDVRAGLVRGARSLVLALFSWLLPLIVLIGAGFLVGLLFTGLEPLWKTRAGTSSLLVAAAWLVILINAAYQDGDPERRPVKLLRLAGSAGGLLLVPIVALAGYALWLRISQYGWTADRVSAAACATVAAAYAVGYAMAALWPKDWFKPLERWNFVTSLVVLGVIAALFSPVVDPARLSVASQTARLEAGKIKPDKFDFAYLRWEGGRYGKEALTRLQTSRDPKIAAAAKAALMETSRFYKPWAPPPDLPREQLVETITVHPDGAKLPDTFLNEKWSTDPRVNLVDTCFKKHELGECHAIVRDIDGDGSAEIMLIYANRSNYEWWYMVAFKQDRGKWDVIGSLSRPVQDRCNGDLDAVLAGQFKTLAPRQRDLEINGRRLALDPAARNGRCPSK